MPKIDEQKYAQQVLFLKKVKDSLPSSISFADEIAELLNVSTDSAYRRMRGETPLTFDEIHTICNAFKFSFDFFNSIDHGSVTFQYNTHDTIIDFKKYVHQIAYDLESIKNAENSKVIYAAVDVPIFHYFGFKELMAFKFFDWSYELAESTTNIKFSLEMIDNEEFEAGRKIYETYKQLNSTEIWTNSTIKGMLRQVEFYWESGMFQSTDDAITIINQFEEELKHIEQQAQHGSKTLDDNKNYEMYLSDVEFSNNCGIVYRNNLKMAYIGYHNFNTMATNNERFSLHTEEWLNQLMKKSTLLSNVSHKHRYQFFYSNYQSIENLRKKIIG